MLATDTSQFAQAIAGSRGTLVFGNGVNALKVEIVRVDGDCIIAEVWNKGEAIAVPVSSVVYYRFANESD